MAFKDWVIHLQFQDLKPIKPFKRFYPNKSKRNIEVSEWNNYPISKDLWVKINYYDKFIITSLTKLEELVHVLKQIQKEKAHPTKKG